MSINMLELDGICIEILRKRIKNIHFRVYPPDGQVKVSVPHRLPLNTIRNQIETRRDWIHRQRAKLLAKPVVAPSIMATGEIHYFLGEAYQLCIHESPNKTMIVLQDGHIHLHTHATASITTKKVILEDWYRQQMKQLLPELIAGWEPVIDVQVKEWGIKIMKTRWGSCNTRAQRIWLNLNLIKKPLNCLLYVLVHEMVHLLEASHNKRFYQLMTQFLPQWPDYQHQLETQVD